MKLHALLSKRETQVAELLAWGASKKEVASKLFVSTRTVENTARNIYAKLGIQKATELCVWWFCTKCGVPVSLDPLKRAFTAILLLLVLLPRELTGNGDLFRIGRDRRIARVTRTFRRYGEDDGTEDFSEHIKRVDHEEGNSIVSGNSRIWYDLDKPLKGTDRLRRHGMPGLRKLRSFRLRGKRAWGKVLLLRLRNRILHNANYRL